MATQFERGRAGADGPDRWYYNATLSNPVSGDTTSVLARYQELRTVPLIDDCNDYWVALARLSVIGSTANLPVLLPPVYEAGVATAPAGYMSTDYWVGLRVTYLNGNAQPVGYSNVVSQQLLIPSNYPAAGAANLTSQFYWVESATQVVTALNEAVYSAYAATNQAVTMIAPVAGTTYATPGNLPLVQGSAFANGVPCYFTLDKGSYRVTAHTPAAALTASVVATAGGTATTSTYTAKVDVLFSDKLLELLPMDVRPAVPGRTDLATITIPAPGACFAIYGWSPSPTGFQIAYTVPAGTYTAQQLVDAVNNAIVTNFAANFVYYNQSRVAFDVASQRFVLTMVTAMPNAASIPVLRQNIAPPGVAAPNTLLSYMGFTAAQYVLQAANPPATATTVITAENPTWLPGPLYPNYPWQTSPQAAQVSSAVLSMYPLFLEPSVADSYDTTAVTPFNRTSAAEYTFEQEYEATSSWSVYTGLAMTSNMIPAYEEAMGLNVVPTTGAVQTSGALTSNIIFDIDLTQDVIHQLQSGIGFVPTVLRYAKLKAGPLNGIDLNFYLRTRAGLYVPWYVTNGGTINVKLLFTKDPV